MIMAMKKNYWPASEAANLILLLIMKTTPPPLPVAKYFKEFIHASVSGSRYPAPGKRISKGTISNYLYVLCFLNEYETR